MSERLGSSYQPFFQVHILHHYWLDDGNVLWEKNTIMCSEVTGLVMEREKIEYRHGNSVDFSKISMPGLVKNSNITLKRGKFEKNEDFKNWVELISHDRSGGRKSMTITLLNEKNEPVASWKALNCFPVKVTEPDLKSDANEIAIESIEIAHEGLTISKV